MNKSDTKNYFLFTAISFVFVVLTTDYISLSDIIYIANQTDVISYSEIAKYAPSFPSESEIIIQHVAQRFLIPYIVGSIAYFINVDFFFVFKIFTFMFIFFYMFLIYKIIKKFNFNLKVSILFFSILFFNPYIIRNHLFNPVQAHDMLFFCLGLLFAFSIIYKKFITNMITTVTTIYLRQSSIALLIGSSMFLIRNKNKEKFLLLLILYFASLFFILRAGHKISIHDFPIKLAYAIIFYDFSQIERLLKFLLLGLMPFLPLTIILFGNLNKNIKFYTAITLLFVCIMMIGQPILGGPDSTVNNIGRIANLCYPILTIFCFYVWNFEKFVEKKFLFYSFVSGLFIWSLHPTFSIFKFFGILRFYNF